MSVHTCEQGHAGVLADGCERCDEHAAAPLLHLDVEKTGRLWDTMVDVEHADDGSYATQNDRIAAQHLYAIAVWMERHSVVDNPFVRWSVLTPNYVKEG